MRTLILVVVLAPGVLAQSEPAPSVAAARELMKRDVAPALFAASKSPDFINDRGHEFGSDLPDDDKYALIEYLKTL